MANHYYDEDNYDIDDFPSLIQMTDHQNSRRESGTAVVTTQLQPVVATQLYHSSYPTPVLIGCWFHGYQSFRRVFYGLFYDRFGNFPDVEIYFRSWLSSRLSCSHPVAIVIPRVIIPRVIADRFEEHQGE